MLDIDPEYTVINESRKRTLARRVRVRASSVSMRKAVPSQDEHSGLWIVPCEAVHTFGMPIRIDAIFIDGQGRVRKIKSNLKASRVAVCLNAHSVLELASGVAEQSGTRVGDRLYFARNVEGGAQWL